MAWGSTHKSKLQTLYRRQKHAIRVINARDRFTHTKPLFIEMNILNLFEINVFKILLFMFKCKLNISPKIFDNLFTFKPPNKYTLRTQFLVEPVIKTKIEEFCINFRGPHLWNKIICLCPHLSQTDNPFIFKKKIKFHIISSCEVEKYF